MQITQQEFEILIKEEKSFSDLQTPIDFREKKWNREIKSNNSSNTFILDFYRGNISIERYSINKRYRSTIILVRYDTSGRHTNPDGAVLNGPHIHLYKEGFNDKWAFDIDKLDITAEDTIQDIFKKLMYFCNVNYLPHFEGSIF